MNKWGATIQTHSRDDLMKVCAILARGIGKERVAREKVHIYVDGSFRGGKSAIVDGLSAAFIDGRTPYKLPAIPLMEDYAGQAMEMDIKKVFAVNGRESLFTFSRSAFVRYKKGTQSKLFDSLGGVSERGIDFRTIGGGVAFSPTLDFFANAVIKSSKADIVISLVMHRYPAVIDWSRKWNIEILNPALQTPQMEEALQDLRNFHARRQTRLHKDQGVSVSFE